MRKYKGLFGSHARRRCPHANLSPVYDDEAKYCNLKWGLHCPDCNRYLDGPRSLAQLKRTK